MRILKYLSFYLCIFTLIACVENKDLEIKSVNLSGSAVRIDSTDMTMYPLFYMNDIVISTKIYGQGGYYGAKIDSFVCYKYDTLFLQGHGNLEFERLMFAKGTDGSLLLLDASGRLSSLVTIKNNTNIESIKDKSDWKHKRLTNLSQFMCTSDNFLPISDSKILVPGAPADQIGHVLSIVDYQNMSIQPLEFWPNDGVETDSVVKQGIYANYGMVFGNNNGRYMYHCGKECYAFIFTIDGNKINVVKELYSKYPDYEDLGDHMNYKIKSSGVERLACQADENYVYVLFKDSDIKGHKITEYEHQSIYGNILEVYDWDGQKQKEIKLDHYGQRIMLDGDKILLLSDDYWGEEPNPEIWIYNLETVN